MIKVNGYKAFHGVMKIIPATKGMKEYSIESDWLYDPYAGIWYNDKGCIIPDYMCFPLEETKKSCECEHNYIEKQVEKNVTVQVLECADCGDISIGWYREE